MIKQDRTIWSRDADLDLILALAFDEPLKSIAARHKRTRAGLSNRIRRLLRSVGQTERRTPSAGAAASAEAIASRPDFINDNDDEYVRRVAKLGGFVSLSERPGSGAACLPLIRPDLTGIAA